MRAAADERRYERAAALHRRRDRLTWLLDRLEGVLRATHAAPRLVVAKHPVKERFDAFWIVHGRVADWGPLPGPSELEARTEQALRRLERPASRSPVPPDEVDEVRIASTWIAEHGPAQLPLDPAPTPDALARYADGATAALAAA